VTDVAKRIQRRSHDPRNVAARVDDRVESATLERGEVAVAVAAELLDAREEFGSCLAAVEQRHLVAVFERRIDDVSAEKLGAPQDKNTH
jgi:hypothetical protein